MERLVHLVTNIDDRIGKQIQEKTIFALFSTSFCFLGSLVKAGPEAEVLSYPLSHPACSDVFLRIFTTYKRILSSFLDFSLFFSNLDIGSSSVRKYCSQLLWTFLGTLSRQLVVSSFLQTVLFRILLKFLENFINSFYVFFCLKRPDAYAEITFFCGRLIQSRILWFRS